jgi:hypothetical protein
MKHCFNEKVIFWTFAGLFISAFVILAVLLVISPKQDLENRGFISCSNQFIENVEKCNLIDSKYRTVICGLDAVVKNTICDFKVVGEGASKWFSGEQTTPWANYLYEPKLQVNKDYIFDDVSDEIDPEFEKLIIEHKKLSQDIDNIKENDSELIPESNLFDIDKFKEIKKDKK